MKRNLIIISAVLLLTAAATFFSSGMYQMISAPVPEEKKKTMQMLRLPAPDFTVQTLDGEQVQLSDFQGKVVVLNFWASWCAPCLVEFPQLLNLAAHHKDKMIFLAVSTDEDEQAMTRFLNKMENINQDSVIIARDPEKRISRDLFQTVRLPETFLITPERLIAEKIIGASVTFDSPAFKNKIEDLYKDR